jgi:hypothetical protein
VDLIIKNLLLDYELLAERAVRLNHSYLELLKVYQELNLAPDYLKELEGSGNSPQTVIEKMAGDRQNLQNEFAQLTRSLNNIQTDRLKQQETEEMQAVLHDCQIMQDFVDSIDLEALKEIFTYLICR